MLTTCIEYSTINRQTTLSHGSYSFADFLPGVRSNLNLFPYTFTSIYSQSALSQSVYFQSVTPFT